MTYQVSVLPSSSNTNKPGTQQAVLDLLKSKFPSATFKKSSTGLWTVTIPDAPVIVPVPTPIPALFVDSMGYPDGLITNEFAYWNPNDGTAVRNPNWEMTSGSVFDKAGAGWSGIPDDIEPNAISSNGNNSADFRMTSKRNDFQNVAVSFRFQHNGFVSTPSTPPVAWDGAHVFLRYQDEYTLYYASFNRRDGTCVIKKKLKGGTSNGGTYYEISSYVKSPFPMGSFQNVKATIKTNTDGSVTIAIYVNDALIVQATDNGIGGTPILAAGKTGIRGDNSNFYFDDFTVNAL